MDFVNNKKVKSPLTLGGTHFYKGKKVRVLKIFLKDKAGNGYIYFPRFNLVLPQGLFENEKNKQFLNKLYNFLDKIKNENRNIVISTERIKRELANVRRLLLEISEACNLRCRYCVYSGAFFDRRKHSQRVMSWEIAKSALDFFINWVIKNERIRYNPFVLSIGFYGGEPLLNFEVLKNTTIYAKGLVKEKLQKRFGMAEVNFDITTNGLLLDQEKIEFLVKNNFRLLISIDGPSEIQNLNKGEGNFESLFPKILYIYERYPEFYKNNLSYSVVYARDTDLEKVRNFFCQEVFENCRRIIFGYVVDDHSNLRFPTESSSEKKVVKEIIIRKKKRIKLYKIEEEILKVYFGMTLNTLIVKEKGQYGGKCVLGSKTLFVRANGDFDGCEKIGEGFKIGNIREGFDFKKILEYEKEWLLKTSKCGACPVYALCNACFAYLGFKGKIDIGSKFCKDILKRFRERVDEYIELQKI